MTKRTKIIYWVATIWLALGMVSTGIVQLIKMEEEVKMMTDLGYPTYLMTILGVWKILGAIAILIPKFPLLKEWSNNFTFCNWRFDFKNITTFIAIGFNTNILVFQTRE